MKEKAIAFVRAMYISIIGLFILSLGVLIWICVGFGVYWVLKYFNVNELLAYVGAFLSVVLPHFISWRASKWSSTGLAGAFMQLILGLLLVFPTVLIKSGIEFCAISFSRLMEKNNDDERENI